MHSHKSIDFYSIFKFVAKSKDEIISIIENNTYPLKQGDMLVFRKNEMHRVFHNKKTKYKRFILMVKPEFFKNTIVPNMKIFLKTILLTKTTKLMLR